MMTDLLAKVTVLTLRVKILHRSCNVADEVSWKELIYEELYHTIFNSYLMHVRALLHVHRLIRSIL